MATSPNQEYERKEKGDLQREGGIRQIWRKQSSVNI